MEKKLRLGHWLLFFASIAAGVAVYFYFPEFTSLMLVPIVTSLAKAMDLL